MEPASARTYPTLTLLAAAFGCAACALAAHIGADARWLSAVGAAIVRAGALPHTIPYAAAPGVAWHDAPALGQLVFHGLQSLLGDKGLVLAQVVAVGSSALRARPRPAAAHERATAPALPSSSPCSSPPRPHSSSFAHSSSRSRSSRCSCSCCGARRAGSSRRIWLAVPLLALWANLHGGVLLGFAVLAAYLLLHRLRAAPGLSIAVLAAAAAALLRNARAAPHGPLRRRRARRRSRGRSTTGSGRRSPSASRSICSSSRSSSRCSSSALRHRPAAWEIVVLVALSGLSGRSAPQRPLDPAVRRHTRGACVRTRLERGLASHQGSHSSAAASLC